MLRIAEDAVADEDGLKWNLLVESGNFVHFVDVLCKYWDIVASIAFSGD